MNSATGLKPSAARYRPSSRRWRRTSSISFGRSRNGRQQRRDEARQLDRDTAKYAVDQLIEDAKDAFKDIPRVVQHIETVRADLIENVGMFVIKQRG